MAQAHAITLFRRRREERLFLTTFSFGHFANDWTVGSILLLSPAIAVGMDLTPAEVGLLIHVDGDRRRTRLSARGPCRGLHP